MIRNAFGYFMACTLLIGAPSRVEVKLNQANSKGHAKRTGPRLKNHLLILFFQYISDSGVKRAAS